MARNKPGSRTKGSRKVQQRLSNLLVETDDKIKANQLGIKDADELEVRGTGKSKKPWTVRKGVYKLAKDTKENRLALREHISKIIKKDGNKDAIKGIEIEGSRKRIGALQKFLDGKVDKIAFRNTTLKNPSVLYQTAGQKKIFKSTHLTGPTIRWMRRLDKDGWPEGKSKEGFKEWMRKSYKEAEERAATETKRTGRMHHAGHGVSSKEFGPNAPSNLADQPAFGEGGNISQGGKTGKSKWDLRRAGVATDNTEAFAEYLMKDDKNILQPTRHTSQQRRAVLHGEGSAEGARISADRELDNKALRRQIMIANKGEPSINMRKLAGRAALGASVLSPFIGAPQGHAAGMLAKTGEKKYIKDLAIASGTDVAVGSAFSVGAKAIGQRALTKGLIKKGLARAVLGTVSGPVGWALLGYSALDTANAFTKAYTGKGLVGHAKGLFIKNQDNPAKGVQIASTKYTPNPVWKMTDQDKKDHMNNMIKRWKSGEETVPLPSDISGPHMRI